MRRCDRNEGNYRGGEGKTHTCDYGLSRRSLSKGKTSYYELSWRVKASEHTHTEKTITHAFFSRSQNGGFIKPNKKRLKKNVIFFSIRTKSQRSDFFLRFDV